MVEDLLDLHLVLGVDEELIRRTFRDLYPASFGGGIHAGLDLDVPLGTKVKAIIFT
jgi:murein DD-endopeptidase MepM/ murein hydrolase activator NlpD